MFIFITLLIFHAASNYNKSTFLNYFKNPYQFKALSVFISAILSAIPGCCGNILVVTCFMQGQLSFGCLIAALLSTLGDASFLLISKEPLLGLSLIMTNICIGTVVGWVSDTVYSFSVSEPYEADISPQSSPKGDLKSTSVISIIFIVLNLPAAYSRIFEPSIISSPEMMEIMHILGFSGAFYMFSYQLCKITGLNKKEVKLSPTLLEKVVNESSFITFWILISQFITEIPAWYLDVNVKSFIDYFSILSPAFSSLIAFIPGCGPQILVTNLYLDGSLQLSALVSNALCNSGDGFIPLLARFPKYALFAKMICLVVALIFGYSLLFLWI